MRCGELLREIEPARGAKQNMRWKLADAYLQHFDADDIARLPDFARVLDVSIGHRGDVPSWWIPTSTKAPNAATFVTTPSRTMPGFRSSSFSTPSRRFAVLKAGRGSRPGFSSPRKMSVTVGTPNTASVNASGSSWRNTDVS
jgi:hypothetical protein